MKYIIEFFKKEQDFFIGSGLMLLSSYITIFIFGILNTYKINELDKTLILLFFCVSYELYRNGLDILFKRKNRR